MDSDKELHELPEWVKLVNRLLHGERESKDEKGIYYKRK